MAIKSNEFMQLHAKKVIKKKKNCEISLENGYTLVTYRINMEKEKWKGD